MEFNLVSEFSPTGDQPQAIKELSDGINAGEKFSIVEILAWDVASLLVDPTTIQY